ncbi:HAD family hydrolase [Ensifer soli]|uniref:HAD family hydrolase n=1 Tax=Ciceribacter sp. sgz301302 TaxID=3342379 RepID=UPI0035B952BB
MTGITAVLWDMDGTLVDSETIAIAALALAIAEQGITPPEDLHHSAAGRAADDLYRWMRDAYGLGLDPLAWERRKLHHYMRQADALRGFDAAIACWRRFEATGIAQAVVSNSDRLIMDVNLRAVGLARPGLVTVARNDVRKGKPDPEGYHRAAHLLGAAPGACLIVEDSLSGAAAGLASGMPVVFVPHATVPAPAGVRPLSGMEELEEIVLGPAEALRRNG